MGSTPVEHSVLNVKGLVGAFNQEKALVGAFSVIVKTDCEYRPPVDGEDVSVPLPEPGHGLVVEVVHLALQVGHAPRLGREHQVYRQQQLTLPSL